MAIENAAELVKLLADEFNRRGTKPDEFAKLTGISEERLELLRKGAWNKLTLREIAIISETLHVDLWRQ